MVKCLILTVAMITSFQICEAGAQQYPMLESQTMSYRSASSRVASNCISKDSGRNRRWNNTRYKCSTAIRRCNRRLSIRWSRLSRTSYLHAA